MTRLPVLLWVLASLGAASPVLAAPAPVPATADADTRAFTLALEAQAAAWTEFRERLGPAQVKFRVFAEEYASYRSLAAIADARGREREAQERFGWRERETPDLLRALDATLRRLEAAGFASTVRRVTDDLDRMAARAAVTASAMEWARQEDPGLADRDAARPWVQLSATAALASRTLAAQAAGLPPAPAVALWAETLPEAVELLSVATARLDSVAREFPQESLCADPGRWPDAQRAFREAKMPSGERPPCAEFLLTAAYPRLRGPVWRGTNRLFFYDPDARVGRFAERSRAELVYRWYPKLKNPPPLTPAWLALRSAALEPAALERARALHARFRSWHGEGGPDSRILVGLGLVQSAREVLRLDADTFAARYLLEAPFTDQVNQLLSADERDGFASGRVTDALTGAPVIGARIAFEADGRATVAQTDTAGAYRLVFPRGPESLLRVTVSRDGFQTLTHAGPVPSPVMVPYDFKLGRLAGRFVVSGIVVGKASKKPVANAVVIAAPAQGSSARVYTGPDGAFRFVLGVAEGVTIELRAQKGDAVSQVKITARGSERRGLRLELEAGEGGDIGQVWEVEDEGPTGGAEAEPDEEPVKSPARVEAKVEQGTGRKPPAEARVEGPVRADAGPQPPRAEGVAGTPPRWGLDGPPARQSGAIGDPCEDAGATLEIVPVAGSFPDSLLPGQSYRVEARIEYRPFAGRTEAARVAVRGYFPGAADQVAEIVFEGPGTRTVSFEFTVADSSSGGLEPESYAGVVAVLELHCSAGARGGRFAAALQRYRRR